MKITLHTHLTHQTTHPMQTQCQQYLSCYGTHFDETLKVDSWEHLIQMPTVTVTFIQTIYVLATFVHISDISAVTDQIFTKLLQQ